MEFEPGTVVRAEQYRALVGAEHVNDAVQKLVQQVLQRDVGQRRVRDPLKIADALRGGRGVGTGILLLSLEHDSLGADIGDVGDQDQTDRGEQQSPADHVASFGGRLADRDRGEGGNKENRQEWQGAARRLDRTGSDPYQHERLIGQNRLRQELQQHQLGNARVRKREHHPEAHLRCPEQPCGRDEIHDHTGKRQGPARLRAKTFVGRKQRQQDQDENALERDQDHRRVPRAGQVGARVWVLAAHEELVDHVPPGSCR